jgi:hypothetical protein
MRMWVSCVEDVGRADIAGLQRSTDEFDRQQAGVLAGTAALARQFARAIG